MITFNRERVKLVSVTFRSSSPSIFPMPLRNLPTSPRGAQPRPSSRRIMAPSPEVFLGQLPTQLGADGYQLVSASLRQIDAGPHYHGSFLFAADPNPDLLPDMVERRPDLLAALEPLTQNYSWRTQVFQAPFVQDRRVIRGQFVVSIAATDNVRMFRVNGQPAHMTVKPGTKRYRDPNFVLLVEGGQLQLQPYASALV